MKYALTCFALVLLYGCNPAQQEIPEAVINDVMEKPPLCRPADVPAGKLEIGGMAFEEPLDSIAVIEEYGNPALEIQFGDQDAAAFTQLTSDRIGLTLEFSLDGEVLMAPRLMDPILGGNVRVSGNFTRAELEDIAVRLAPPCAE